MDIMKMTVDEIKNYLNSYEGDIELLLEELEKDERKSVGKLVLQQKNILEKRLLEKIRLEKLWKIERVH